MSYTLTKSRCWCPSSKIFGRAVVEQARRKDREHAGVGIGKRLARAIGVEEAQRRGRNVVGPPDHEAHALLVELGERIHRCERGGLVFRRGRGHQRQPVFVAPLPVAAPQLLERALLHRAELAACGAVKAFAIQAHARCNDQLLHRLLDQRLQQHRGAQVVHPRVVRHLVHALAHAHCRREVVDRVHALERIAHRGRVAHVANDEFDVGLQVVGPAAAVAMHLRRKVVENANAIAVGEKLVCEMRADETGAAGDENLLRHETPFLFEPPANRRGRYLLFQRLGEALNSTKNCRLHVRRYLPVCRRVALLRHCRVGSVHRGCFTCARGFKRA